MDDKAYGDHDKRKRNDGKKRKRKPPTARDRQRMAALLPRFRQ